MTHWSHQYIGKPYTEADCAQLAILVLKNEFNQVVNLPTERGDNVFSLSSQIAKHQGDYAEKTNRPTEGDAVLMRCRGRLNHIGIYCDISGQAYVLHALRGAGQACLHRLDALPGLSLEVEGFYRWR